MTIEEFKNLAQGIQAILIAIAAIIASGWAVYTFRSLLSVQKATIELEKIQTELIKHKAELSRIQKELESKPMVQISVEPSLLKGNNNLFIRVKITFENTGNTQEFIDWEKSSITAALVLGITDGKLLHTDPIVGILGRINAFAVGEQLWPGEIATDEAIIPINEHGIYVIEVKGNLSVESAAILKNQSGKECDSIMAGTSLYFDTGS
ncbi:hypothetical protein [Rheinheimera soli]|uniref:Uncharacterized protein n=1 Tax=Rheinheimera soli TaxID=443616 RepID=A0ABU1W333_9GAMM|nr:hypothetical protein [Rheinheimera soli]MDR7122374.1 hypothetical protein [Rheinheimera soli]